MSERTGDRHALIAGAGVGGLTAALALARRGWRVTLLERRDANENIGAGLQISPNASAILRELGILPKIIAAGLKPSAIHIRNHGGRTLTRLPLTDAESRWGAPYIDVHRADLVSALHEAVHAQPNIVFHPQTRVAGFDQQEDTVTIAALRGAMRLSFTADCLIGADGVRSLVRARLTSKSADDLPQFAQYVAWRALVPAERVSNAFCTPENNLWLGPRAHLVHYPLREGRVINVVAVIDARQPFDDKNDIWSQVGDPEDIREKFARWATPARDLIAAAPDWRTWPLIERATLPRWSHGRITLLGDAAHAMLPFLAQGAAQAIEDAASLAECLDEGTAVPTALALYSAKRSSRAARVQAKSRRQAAIYHMGAPGRVVRDLVLRAADPGRLMARFDWLYGSRGTLARTYP